MKLLTSNAGGTNRTTHRLAEEVGRRVSISASSLEPAQPIITKLMWERLKELFCCTEPQNIVTPVISNRRRVTTAYSAEQVEVVADEVRRAGAAECFCCPICFLYFTSTPNIILEILCCSECHNFICCNCLNLMVEKADRESSQIRCCFCSSESCRFEDWKDGEQKRYFDMTNKEAFKQIALEPESSSV